MMRSRSNKKLKQLSSEIRKQVLTISYKAGVGHVGSALSVVEILVALYFEILNIRPKQPKWPLRDRFILSKGHAVNALYPILSERGYFPKKYLKSYCINGGKLGEHPEISHVSGIELPTGSLGHGLSVGAGVAFGAKKRNLSYRSYVLLSDAECNEGETWEAALFSGHHKLDNLITIIDYNKVQALGKTHEVLDLDPFAQKWQAFNWEVEEVDGHDIGQLIKTFRRVPFKKNKPSMIIAHTIRGKNVSFMEHVLAWHYLSPTKDHYDEALKELANIHA